MAMRLSAFRIIGSLCLPINLTAAATPEECQLIGDATQDAGPSLIKLLKSLDEIDEDDLMRTFNDREMVETLNRMKSSRIVVMKALRTYLNTLQDLTYKMQVCAR